MELNDILTLNDIELTDVAVILHTPNTPKLARVLPLIVAEKPDVYAAYQSVHSDNEGATLKNRSLALTFITIGNGQMVFAGLFRIIGWSDWPLEKVDNDPSFRELAETYGDGWASDYARDKGEAHRCVFDMEPDVRLKKYIGRIVIAKPKGRRLIRKMENLEAGIEAISQDSLLTAALPGWRDIALSAAMIRTMPYSWATMLREWRGVYLIVDEVDGARYVGSAYGEENLLGRWKAHVAGEQGVTKELKKRNPRNFRFSILQLLTHDAEPSDVIKIEHNWMTRLHTREYGLNA